MNDEEKELGCARRAPTRCCDALVISGCSGEVVSGHGMDFPPVLYVPQDIRPIQSISIASGTASPSKHAIRTFGRKALATRPSTTIPAVSQVYASGAAQLARWPIRTAFPGYPPTRTSRTDRDRSPFLDPQVGGHAHGPRARSAALPTPPRPPALEARGSRSVTPDVSRR